MKSRFFNLRASLEHSLFYDCNATHMLRDIIPTRVDSRFAPSQWGDFVTTSPIGWAQAYNEPCPWYFSSNS